MSHQSLEEYLAKRDFSSTPEPGGSDEKPLDGNGHLFVVQEHDATSHHFDFRLQIGDALRSWAVPKGPSTDPGQRRLAIPTEDHPLAYADFEGVIPQGQYGGGTVLVWDAGTYRDLATDDDGSPVPLERQLDRGHATFWLEGSKLKGGYALIRNGSYNERWLLVKMDDDEADARRNPVSTEPHSVLSGRTLAEIAEQEAPAREAATAGADA